MTASYPNPVQDVLDEVESTVVVRPSRAARLLWPLTVETLIKQEEQ